MEMSDDLLDFEKFQFLLKSSFKNQEFSEKPKFLENQQWQLIYNQLFELQKLKNFKGIIQEILQNQDFWKKLYNTQDTLNMQLPLLNNKQIKNLDRLLMIKIFREDNLIQEIQQFIENKLGEQFIQAPILNVDQIASNLSFQTPLIFIISPGSDSKSFFDQLVESQKVKKVVSVSLGQGQGDKCQKLIKEYKKINGKGGWVLLQNCHLLESWMPSLENLYDEITPENTHPDFRLFLSSRPSKNFSSKILQNSLKITLEPPQGIKDNLKSFYSQLKDEEILKTKNQNAYKKLLFGLSFFHSVIMERKNFGPIGFNIPYEFSKEDLKVSVNQLQSFIEEYEEIPFKVLNFITGQINYGGRVTDDKDKILLSKILEKFLNPKVLTDDYRFSSSKIYYSYNGTSQQDYLNYIESLPQNPSTNLFGLHDNAQITTNQNKSRQFRDEIYQCYPEIMNSSINSYSNNNFQNLLQEINDQIPQKLDMKRIKSNYPIKYEQSLNTVLRQESAKYNKLIDLLIFDMKKLTLINKGEIVMSDYYQGIILALNKGKVPEQWGKTFLSLKSLFSWFVDLNKRIEFFQNWVKKGSPEIFWLSGFTFPQAFLTGLLQNYARKQKIAIDQVQFEFSYDQSQQGTKISGLFIEGSSWNTLKKSIQDPIPKQLFSNMPIINFIPTEKKKSNENVYHCPLYRVISRKGQLSTTGHSTNYVMRIELPSQKPENYWILAGTALFLSLKYQINFILINEQKKNLQKKAKNQRHINRPRKSNHRQ